MLLNLFSRITFFENKVDMRLGNFRWNRYTSQWCRNRSAKACMDLKRGVFFFSILSLSFYPTPKETDSEKEFSRNIVYRSTFMNSITITAIISTLFTKMYCPSAFLINSNVEINLSSGTNHLTRYTGHCHTLLHLEYKRNDRLYDFRLRRFLICMHIE